MIFSVIEQALIALPLILGAYLTLSLLKLPDFSLESAYLFGAVTAFLARELPIPLIAASAMCGGMIVGMTVCFFNRILHIPFLLAAIVTNGLFHGLTQYFLGTSVRSFHSVPINDTVLLSIVAILSVGFTFFLVRSQLGYCLAIYGNNPRFFHRHHISERYIVFFGVTAGHGLAGISGFLFARSGGFVDLSMNFGVILLCLTGLMVGKIAIRKSLPAILLPIVGIFAYYAIQQILLIAGLNLKYFNAFQAVFIVFILLTGRKKETFTLDHLGV